MEQENCKFFADTNINNSSQNDGKHTLLETYTWTLNDINNNFADVSQSVQAYGDENFILWAH